jgi:hypothetical protein
MVAKAAKSIAKGGIVTSEHINEAIRAWNQHFDDNVDPRQLKIILIKTSGTGEKADNDFKSKRKKSLLGRLIEGGNPNEITNA